MYTDALFGFLTHGRVVLQSPTATIYYHMKFLGYALRHRSTVDVCDIGVCSTCQHSQQPFVLLGRKFVLLPDGAPQQKLAGVRTTVPRIHLH
ncbi:hypothetical protein ARMGADRAFT_140634 [Armillaria gallica]|uniref:Uncharacterized protein n=1 Tax=Armillaria gallica TaxID=47427 RepID=A0A2H3DUU3_ARMGA|nr:hypothetical protein ARMGADRAFT_140634 [Armillaria gallica]